MSAMQKTLRTFFILGLMFQGFGGSPTDAQPPLPVGQREYDIIYDRLEHDEVLSRSRFDFQLGPYTRVDSSHTAGPFDNRRNLGPTQFQIFGFAAESFKSTPDARGRMYALGRAGAVGQPFNHLSVMGQFYLDERKAHDPNYAGKKWRGFAGDIDLAFVHYSSNRFDFTVGRFSSFWGVRRSLVLGSSAHLDGFGYTLNWGKLSISYRFAKLGDRMTGTDTLSQWPNRYFAAHRFDVQVSDAVRVGLFESVVFGGPGRSPDVFYLNPIIFYHGTQLNENVDDNTFVGVDFTYKPTNGLKLYGQLLIDDIQLDKKSRGDHEPAQYGLITGLYTASGSRGFDTRTEYTRVTDWTFNQILPRNRYTDHDGPIGDASGNDYDRLTFDLIRWLKREMSGTLRLSYLRRGEGRINAPWTSPWLNSPDYHQPFPSGVVEKTASVALGVKGFATPALFAECQAGVSRVVNYNHHAGDNRTLPFIDCYISVYLSHILNLD
ncbi:MAG: hypothetical protein HY851_04885 [candidate division Zixibacteria bacterium]|nr:hypothetical protein [candidate division Zixibacteria bacterium]